MITLQTATSRLASRGSVLTVWNSPSREYLVGDLYWLGANRLFWFAAHGDSERDGHTLEFDHAEPLGENVVQFFRGDTRVACLTAITVAEVDDREDFAVAFSLWQQVAPRSRALIERALARCEMRPVG